MTLNLTLVALYCVNLWLQSSPAKGTAPLWLAVLAIAMLLASGWLGGKMVYQHAVAVDTVPPRP